MSIYTNWVVEYVAYHKMKLKYDLLRLRVKDMTNTVNYAKESGLQNWEGIKQSSEILEEIADELDRI